MKKFYENEFENFLVCTDEKKVLFEEILKEIKNREVSSMLDLGAGNGFLSVPLSKQVDRYVAVEKSTYFAKKLDKLNIEVVKKNFPFKIKEKFDMVLISHSLPKKNYKRFIKSAFDTVEKGGCLLIINGERKNSDWVKLLKKIGEGDEFVRDHLSESLKLLGKVDTRKVKTRVCGKNKQDLLHALSFVFSDGDKKLKKKFLSHKEEVVTFLSKYETKNEVLFPFYHLFTIIKKDI